MISELVTTRRLSPKAIVCIRQSHPHQVLRDQESLRLRYALRQRACDLGWQEPNVEVVDVDLGLSGAAGERRRGFKDLIARVTLGEVGFILSYDVARLRPRLLGLVSAARPMRLSPVLDRGSRWRLRSRVRNDRLLLGLKGTISEVELHTMRGRLTAGLLNKAERSE